VYFWKYATIVESVLTTGTFYCHYFDLKKKQKNVTKEDQMQP